MEELNDLIDRLDTLVQEAKSSRLSTGEKGGLLAAGKRLSDAIANESAGYLSEKQVVYIVEKLTYFEEGFASMLGFGSMGTAAADFAEKNISAIRIALIHG
jgi:hypothetical protein